MKNDGRTGWNRHLRKLKKQNKTLLFLSHTFAIQLKGFPLQLKHQERAKKEVVYSE